MLSVRPITQPKPIRPLAVTPPLRILAMIASPIELSSQGYHPGAPPSLAVSDAGCRQGWRRSRA